MSGGSINLRRFRCAIRDGASVEDACAISEISKAEAAFILRDDAVRPPPPEAYTLPDARKEKDMARGAAKTKPIAGEVVQPDFDLAVKIYREDIRRAQGKVGEHSQELSTAYKEIKNKAHIQSGAAKQAFKLMNTEDAKRDDWIRCFLGLCDKLGIMPTTDLVDQAEGKGKAGERPKPKLVTVPAGPADDSDLSGDADEPSAVENAKAEAGADDDEFYDSKAEAAE